MIFAARAARFFVRGVTERCLHFTMGRTHTIPYEGSGVIFSYNFRFGENNNDPDKSGFSEKKMATYKMKFMFDWGSAVCLWSMNKATEDRFGDYPIDLSKLPISDDLKTDL
jgi:hypothetical protein